MYDKFGVILRMETVINYPKEFSVYRTRHHHAGTSSVGYYPMTKSVASLLDYHAWVDASRSSQADHGSDCLGAQPYGSLGCLLNSKAQQRPDLACAQGWPRTFATIPQVFHDNKNSMSSRERFWTTPRPSAFKIASAKSRFFCCNSRIFSSTVSRQISR
jgi:hypothetical protein